MTQPPFEFGLVSDGQCSPKEWYDLAETAERLGYHALLVSDHVQQRMAAIPALAAAAAVTSRLRLGTYVLNSDLRNPVVMARAMAGVHALSGGRAILGMGAGWLSDDYVRVGTTFESGAIRLARLRQAFGMVRATLAEDTASDAAGGLGPMRTMLGGSRPGLLTLAGREADIVSVAPASFLPGGSAEPWLPSAVDAAVDRIREGAAGRDSMPVLNHVVWECYVTHRAQRVFEALAEAVGAAPDQVRAMPAFLVGTVEEVAETLLDRRKRWGFSLVTIPAAAAEAFAPVAARLTGR